MAFLPRGVIDGYFMSPFHQMVGEFDDPPDSTGDFQVWFDERKLHMNFSFMDILFFPNQYLLALQKFIILP